MAPATMRRFGPDVAVTGAGAARQGHGTAAAGRESFEDGPLV